MPRNTEYPGYEVTEDGDVAVPSGDFDSTTQGSDDERYEFLIEEERIREAKIAAIRGSADFTKRNRLLVKAGDLAAHSRLSETFAAKLDREGGDSLPADRRAASDQSGAIRAIREACGECALKPFCELKADGVIQAIGLGTEVSKTTSDQRGRLRTRLKNKKNENNHFCETNLKPGRLKNEVA